GDGHVGGPHAQVREDVEPAVGRAPVAAGPPGGKTARVKKGTKKVKHTEWSSRVRVMSENVPDHRTKTETSISEPCRSGSGFGAPFPVPLAKHVINPIPLPQPVDVGFHLLLGHEFGS